MEEHTQNYSSDCIPHNCCDENKHSILAFNIYDQCKQKLCDCCGPAISEEPCECVILENLDCEFGRYIFPGRPITLPNQVTKVKILADSFKVKTVGVIVKGPSQFKKGFWDIDVQIKYECKLQFYDCHMQPLKIKCLPSENTPEILCAYTKDYICASICCINTYTLFGGKEESTIVCTDGFCSDFCEGWPHAMVKLKAHPLDASIVCICDTDCSEDIYDCVYEDPIRYIYIKVGAYILVYLYRLVSLCIKSNGFSIPDDYMFSNLDICEQFLQSDCWQDEQLR